MFHVSQDKYKRLPDEATRSGDDFQTPAPPIPMKIFDKTTPSTEYVSVPSNEPGPLDYPTRELRSDLRWHSITGWRAGAMVFALLALVSLLLNIAVAIWASRVYGTYSAIVEVFYGDCRNVQKINTWIHLGINALSTGLLSGSNYCMQCLSAPTRKEVDKTHAKGRWVDIGVPSIRNLRTISRKKVGLWWLLGLSSIPLHLMYNSAFFSSLETNDYQLLYVSEDFVTGASFNTTSNYPYILPGIDIGSVQTQLDQYQKLQNAECIDAYAVDFVTDRRTLVLVTANGTGNSNNSLLDVDQDEFQPTSSGTQYTPYEWICSDPNLADKILVPSAQADYDSPSCYTYVSRVVADAQQWAPEGYAVKYCLSEQVPGTCGLNLNLIIIAVVATCNLGKVIGMLYVAFWIQDDPLITIGDAIESFLLSPDNSTRGRCLTTKQKENVLVLKAAITSQRLIPPAPETWQPIRQRWFNAASKLRWRLCISLFIIALVVIGGLLGWAISSLPDSKSVGTLWSYGFGTVHPQALISGWGISNLSSPNSQILAAVLVANLPQPLLSFLYLTLNGLCTSMFLADEWSRFGHYRKPLRVSTPKSGQRKTYFLQLPYRIALPLMAMSGLLHWLVSQSIFLAVIAEYEADGYLVDSVAVATCGFSPFAMITVLIAGGALILFAIGLGYRRFDGSMPLVGSCSAAISAACHAPPWDRYASTKAIQWGSVGCMASSDGIGHCCFSSGRVEEPVPGQEYAGVHEKTFRSASFPKPES